MKGTTPIALFIGLAGSAMLASPAYAGGFYLQEQSPVEVGRAFSGEAAAGDDASVIYYNPAAMTQLDGLTITAGGSLLFADTRQTNNGSSRTVPGLPVSVPVSGSDGGNPFDQPIVIPSVYAVGKVTDRLSLGLGVNAPFGVKLKYDDDFFGRYDSLKTDLKTYNIGASAAYKITDNLSVGAGVDVQYAKVTLTNAVPNLSPMQPDAFAHVSGDDWAVGWNAGIFYKTDSDVRFGFSYRSGIKHKLSGTYMVSGLQAPLDSGNVTLPATAPLNLPDIYTASVNAPINSRTRIFLTGRFYKWSNLKEINIQPQGADSVVKPLDYKDSMSISLGGEYAVSPKLTLRAGTMYDQTPTNKYELTTRIPDGDRYWATVGATYHLSPRFAVNVAYAHTFVDDAKINRDDSYFPAPATVSVNTLASTRSSADQVALSLTTRL